MNVHVYDYRPTITSENPAAGGLCLHACIRANEYVCMYVCVCVLYVFLCLCACVTCVSGSGVPKQQRKAAHVVSDVINIARPVCCYFCYFLCCAMLPITLYR